MGVKKPERSGKGAGAGSKGTRPPPLELEIMAKRNRPPPGKCVHCLCDPVERNWDHVFPESWYPDSTPENLEKWKVPSCLKCNSELGKIESKFLSLIALSLDPKALDSQGITQKVLRSLKAEHARSESDARARTAAARRVTSSIYRGPIDEGSIYPTASEGAARASENPIPILIPEEGFRRITEKIVRGITYVESGRFVEPPFEVKFYALRDEHTAELRAVLDSHGTTLSREPGIVIRRAVAVEDGMSGLYEITFWGQFKTHASVGTSDFTDGPDPPD
jgi:hypothetical protein